MALPSSRRNHPRVIVASASDYAGDKTSYSKRQSESWQRRALEYYGTIGEVRYASQFYARMLSRIRIYPALLQPSGETDPITSGAPLDLLNRIQDPGGGRSQLQGSYGRLMFVTGEGVLFGSRVGTEEERWRFLWLEEVKEEDGVVYRVDKAGQKIEVGVAYRMWRPSPKHSDEADAPIQSVQEVCEELILLTKSVTATALSRITNGLLLMPQEISPGPAEPIGDEDPENNPFIADVVESYVAQIEDPGSAEARMPPIVEGPHEYLDGIRWMQLHDPTNDYMERDLRTEAIKRLALGLDFPPEVLLGMTDANHWTAKQVVHDMWRSHGAPIADQFCDDLSEAYLRPALREAGYEDWTRVVVDYDDADVVVAPDRSDDADKAIQNGQINDDGYLELKGFPVSYKPDEEEKQLWIAMQMKDPRLLPKKYVPEGVSFDSPAPDTPGPDAAPQNPANPEDGPPEPTPGRNGSRPETASAKIMGAAELSLMRCREIAGARLRGLKDSCPDCLEPANGKPNALVAALVGQEALGKINAPPPLKLVAGGSELFRGALLNWGFADTQARALAEMIEVHAARTLFEEHPTPLSSGFAAHVERVRDIADALSG